MNHASSKEGCLYRSDQGYADAEEELLVHGYFTVDLLGKQEIEVAAKFNPVK
jgi:hypothetical protein